MAKNDAEMPSHQALSEEIQEISKHLATLRRDVEGLTGQLKRSGEHQIERAQDKASEAVTAVESAVRRDPRDGARHRARAQAPSRHRDPPLRRCSPARSVKELLDPLDKKQIGGPVLSVQSTSIAPRS
jgi:hypothetical protein